jgi:hypothetical protein
MIVWVVGSYRVTPYIVTPAIRAQGSTASHRYQPPPPPPPPPPPDDPPPPLPPDEEGGLEAADSELENAPPRDVAIPPKEETDPPAYQP